MYTENFRVTPPPPPPPGLQPSLQKLQVFFAVGGGRGANSRGGVSLFSFFDVFGSFFFFLGGILEVTIH